MTAGGTTYYSGPRSKLAHYLDETRSPVANAEHY